MSNYPQILDGDQERPTSVHAEMTILGAIMLEPTAIVEATALLTSDDFALDSHRKIYSAILGLLEDKSGVDYITIEAELARRKELDSVGGFPYLLQLTEGIPRRLSIESYVRIVRNKSMMRRMMEVCDMGLLEGADQSREALDVANDVMGRLTKIVEEGTIKCEVIGPMEMSRDAEKRLLDNVQPTKVIPTGIEELDKMTGGGIRPEEVWVIGASPSRGKTTLARQIAKHCVWRDVPTYVHSGEMSKESWFDVTACLLEGIPAWKIREPQLLNYEDKDRLRCGIRSLGQMPLHISDTSGIHIDELIWNATQAIRLQGMKLGIYDYAQIIKAGGDDKQRVTTVAQRIRQFHKDTKTSGIILSQSPRPDGKYVNTRPTMHSLKESGSLEEVAHVVILPYRPIDIETGKWTGEDELIVGKNRWGALGTILTHLNGQYLRFDSR